MDKVLDTNKFTMEVAHGVKNMADVERLGAENAPDLMKPFCKEHRAWPCRYCGTSHFEGCECPVCVEPTPAYVAKLEKNDAYERAQTALDDAFEALKALKQVLRKLRDD